MIRYQTILLAVIILLLMVTAFVGPAMAKEEESLPLSVRRVLYQAQTLVAENRLEEARLKLEAYRRKKQRSHYMLEFSLGDIWIRSEAYMQAAGAYRKSLELKEDFAPAWMNLGKAVYEMADYETAAGCFERAYRTAAEPHPERLYYSATAYLMANKPQRSLELFKRLMSKHPAALELEWKATLVQVHLALAHPLEALPLLEELAAKSESPQKEQWQETLLGHYMQLGRTDRAIAYARELTQIAPLTARWWKALAHLLLQNQAFEPALEALIIYAKLAPPTPVERKLLADLSLQVGIPNMVVSHYLELVSTSPDVEILSRLTFALRQLGQQPEALRQIEYYLAKEADAEILWLKGELLYEMKRYPDAAATFRRCAQNNFKAGRAWLMAGYASWQAQELLSARKDFKRAAEYPKQKNSAFAALKALDSAPIEPGS